MVMYGKRVGSPGLKAVETEGRKQKTPQRESERFLLLLFRVSELERGRGRELERESV